MYNDDKVKRLHIILPKTSAEVEIYDGQTKWMHFVIEDDYLLETYNTIWDKARADIKKNLITSLSIIKIFSKIKIKSHGNEVTDFFDKKIPKVNSNHTCLAVISLDFALKKNENYYLQVFLKECKHIEKKVIRHINDNLSNFFSSDESDQE